MANDGSPCVLLGVIIVSYASNDVIIDCLDSLRKGTGADLRIVVCDNDSPDDTSDLVRDFARQKNLSFLETTPVDLAQPDPTTPLDLTLITSPENLGYAGAVNIGLDYLMKSQDVHNFWVLNPDSVVQENTARAYATRIANSDPFGLMAGRTLYLGEGGMIQSDGGAVSLWTGVCRNLNQGKFYDKTAMPDVGMVNFLSGANLIASRDFVTKVGKMQEDYFLYYEEVDWAIRRGDLPLVLCPDAIVLHHGGTAIGSGTTKRLPSAFSNYFNYRNRMLFMRRFNPLGLPISYSYSLLKIFQLILKGARPEALGAWKGLNLLHPPADVENKVAPRAQKHAFGSKFKPKS